MIRGALILAPMLVAASAGGLGAGRGAEQRDMRLVGHEALQGRSAYQPVPHRQGDRVLVYVGHHAGSARNPLTGRDEPNGTSIVDVTDPGRPLYRHHLPAHGGEQQAQMVQVCDGRALPRGDRGKTYLLRTNGNRAHEVWDVTEPARPAAVATVQDGLRSTHKNWWDCATGLAYLVSDGRPFGWRTDRMLQVFDLADPASPRHLRDVGLPGHEPGATGAIPPGLHEATALGKRLYLAYGTSAHGVLQILDRETFRQPPFPVATFQVAESSGRFCRRGGRFGAHSINWSFSPRFYRKLIFVAYFNAGVRAVDIRDPFRPSEVAFFIPATTANTTGPAIQTNNVEVDDRGLVYLADRAGTGLHIVELTGAARRIVAPGGAPGR